MSFRRAGAFAELLRPLNTLIIMAVVVSAALLAGGGSESFVPMIVAALAGGFIGGGANVINDYFDVAIDKVNKPDRPLARGAVGKKEALVLWFFLSVVGISLNLFLNFAALGIATGAVVLLFLYSARLKGTILIGNLTVAFMTGLAFLYGAIVIGRPEASLLPACFAFLINLAREIVKDVEDMEGDRLGHALTFPLKHGVKPALGAASIVLLALIAATLWAYAAGKYSQTYLILVLFVDAVLIGAIVAMWINSSREAMRKISSALKLGMLLGLAAIFFGS